MARTHITGPEFSGENTTGNLAAQLVASFGGTISTTGLGTPGANCPAGLAPGVTAGTDNNRGVFNAVFTLSRDLAPQAKSTTLLAAAQTAAAAGALTLASATVAGTGSSPRLTVFTDTAGRVRLRLDTPRCLAYVMAASGAAGVIATVKGYDEYGVAMQEQVTFTANSTVNGTKAFLDVYSVTVSAATTQNVSIGTTDILGLPYRTDRWAFIDIVYNDALISATTGFVAAVTTSPATATTGDVRGTYALQSAADGSKTFQLFNFIPQAAATDRTLVYGVTQYST